MAFNGADTALVYASAASEPIAKNNENHNTIYGRDIVHVCEGSQRKSLIRFVRGKKDLLPVFTGIVDGKEYITRQKMVHRMVTMLAKAPHFPSQKGPCLMLSRPRYQRHTMGQEYEMYRRVIQAVTILLKAVEEPR